MPLSQQQKKSLKQRAHHLKPVIRLGAAGLSDAVLAEVDATLEHHELLKIKIGEGERDERRAIASAICEQLGAELIQRIGNTVVIYRENPDKNK